MSNLNNLAGQRFGRLLVLGLHPVPAGHGKHARWICLCECGAQRTIRSGNLLYGKTRSCGCLKVDLYRTRMARRGRIRGAVLPEEVGRDILDELPS